MWYIILGSVMAVLVLLVIAVVLCLLYLPSSEEVVVTTVSRATTEAVEEGGTNESLWRQRDELMAQYVANKTLPPSELVEGLWLGGLRTDAEWWKRHHIAALLELGPWRLRHEDPHIAQRLWISLGDAANVAISKHFDAIATFLHEAFARKRTIYVHCQMGISRSATSAIAYLSAVSGFDPMCILNWMRTRRSIVNPNEGFQQQLQRAYRDGTFRSIGDRLRAQDEATWTRVRHLLSSHINC